MNARLSRQVWITTILISLSGLALWISKYFFTPLHEWDAVHPAVPWALRAHIIATPFAIFALGAVMAAHVWPRIESGMRCGRRTGLFMVGILLPMVLSGFLLQVITADRPLRWTAYVHIGIGLLFVAGFAAHQIATWRHQQ